ncbi:MFS transporter [Brachybacterium sp. SGAir0954]|uniref:MFS transporter n=1 Tax=Brachybacterium sp. SGAir0954 TaxID=2571029 RepID=UPI0010CCEFD9|nr:MFS transporter [Brachybacterium sp. SGAir0954]QCR52244.1 MFS transporter [Brachybacterium sp. SGAir0954]
MPTAPAPPSTRTRPLLLLVAVLSGVIVLPLSVAGTSVLLPGIARDLGAAPVLLQGVVNGFNVSFALSTLAWGLAADRVGLRRIFLVNVLVLAAGAVASALAPGLVVLDVMRVVAGAGAGAIQVAAASLLSTAFTGAARARAFALLGTVLGVGLAFGPTVSGLVADQVGWRGVFLLPLLPLAVVLVLRRHLPSAAAASDVDRAASSAAGPSAPPGRSELRDPRFLALCVVTVIQSVGFIAMLTYMPTALSAVRRLDEGSSGLVMLVMTAPVLVLPALAARVMARRARITAFTVVHVSLACVVLGNVVLLGAMRPGGGLVPLLVGMVLVGASFGLPLGLVDGEALACAEPSRQGWAAGVLNAVRISSEAAAVALYGTLLAAAVHAAGDDDGAAARVATGAGEHPGWYAEAFRELQIGVVAVIVLLSVLTVVLHLRSRAERP